MKPVFTRSADKLLRVFLVALVVSLAAAIGMATWLFSPRQADVGYSPVQPVPYSHKLHAGDLGMDCRYCHTAVETSAMATVPPTETCMNCHARVKNQSPLLAPVRESYATGKPVRWVRIHRLPDFAFFNHSVHISAGVGCVNCHGRVDQMIEVKQVEPLNMAWCLECHRRLAGTRGLSPPTHCSGCHR